MFSHTFFAGIRHFIIPAGAIWVIQQTPLGPQAGMLAVNIVLTLVTIPFVVFNLIKILPSLALIRARHIMILVLEVIIAISAVLFFWLLYLAYFG
jgi:hypothetical protein